MPRSIDFRKIFRTYEPIHANPHTTLTTQNEDSSPEHGVAIWRWITTMFFLDYSDAQFWWGTTGYALAVLLHQADYSTESQYRHLIFFAFLVAPELGPAPNKQIPNPTWKSFMTDDNTPIELSWDWGLNGDAPAIRYSIEPIGTYAGTSADRFNQYAGPQLLRQLSRSLPGMDLKWFEHFSNELLIFQNLDGSNTENHESRFFAAFDLYPTHPTAKAYFFPAFKAIKNAQSKLNILSEAFIRLPGYLASDYSAFDLLKSYMQAPPANGSMEVEMLAIDCVVSAKSRYKIYTRSRFTNFDSVKTIMTLTGKLDSPNISKGLRELKILWDLLFGASHSSTEELPHSDHRTAGILYNFEIRRYESLPVPKIYIPVRHYAQNDLFTIHGLQKYLLRHRRDHQSMDKYMQAIDAIL
jgi:DMATS type aromatic prenyltransferase